MMRRVAAAAAAKRRRVNRGVCPLCGRKGPLGGRHLAIATDAHNRVTDMSFCPGSYAPEGAT